MYGVGILYVDDMLSAEMTDRCNVLVCAYGGKERCCFLKSTWISSRKSLNCIYCILFLTIVSLPCKDK